MLSKALKKAAKRRLTVAAENKRWRWALERRMGRESKKTYSFVFFPLLLNEISILRGTLSSQRLNEERRMDAEASVRANRKCNIAARLKIEFTYALNKRLSCI